MKALTLISNRCEMIRNLAVAGLLLASACGYSQQDNTAAIQTNPGPVVDSSDVTTRTPKEDHRRSQYNSRGTPRIEDYPSDATPLLEIRDIIGGKNPIPTDRSDAIFIGQVEQQAAHFSEDHTGVFSTFQVNVTKVLSQNKLTKAITVGSSVILERPGGRVRYPSGQIDTYGVYGRPMPKSNSTYIFFVQDIPGLAPWTPSNDEGLDILTGYELRDNKVYALDRKPRPGALLYETYDGTSEDDFLRLVEAYIQKRRSGTTDGGGL